MIQEALVTSQDSPIKSMGLACSPTTLPYKSSKWSYTPSEWPYVWVTGVINLLIRGGFIYKWILGPPCMIVWAMEGNLYLFLLLSWWLHLPSTKGENTFKGSATEKDGIKPLTPLKFKIIPWTMLVGTQFCPFEGIQYVELNFGGVEESDGLFGPVLLYII